MDIIIEHQLMHCIECGLELSSDEQNRDKHYCVDCLLDISHDGKLAVFKTVKDHMEANDEL